MLHALVHTYMAISRFFIYTKRDRVNRATITERALLFGGVRLPAGEQSDALGLLRLNDRRSRHRRIKKQRRYERLLPQASYPCGKISQT